MHYLDTAAFDTDEIDAILALVRSHGLDPNNYRSPFAVTATDDGYALVLAPGTARAPGREIADPLDDYETVVVPIGRELPGWLAAVIARFGSKSYAAYMQGARDALDAVAMHHAEAGASGNAVSIAAVLNLALGTVQTKADLRAG